MAGKGLGRLPEDDPKNRNFLMRMESPLPKLLTGVRHWWDNGWWGDQGFKPQCVGYASAHYLEDSPLTHPEAGPYVDPQAIYDGAQRMDDWPLPHDGTSGLAACKWMLSQGLIERYTWGYSAEDVINAVLTLGPVLIGIPWFNSMDEESSSGILRIDTH